MDATTGAHTMTTAEHAIAIARVSTGRQDEEDQAPGLVRYSDGKGYVLDAVVPIHGKSAFHGKHRKEVLAAVEEYVRHGAATVVIFRHVDRSSRQGVFEGYRLVLDIMDAGARVEFSEQDHLNAKPELLGLYFDMAKAESDVKKDRKLQGNARRRAGGELVGRVPWGYDPVLRDGIQAGIRPNALGREWIPRIFQAAVDGKSLRTIAGMLRGIPSPQRNGAWNEASIRRILGNTTYCGQMTNNPNMVFESLVGAELHQKAGMAVDGRVRRGRGTVKRDPVMVKPWCGACLGVKRDGAPSGKSPMYRVSRQGYDYYGCKGHGPARVSCGAKCIPVKDLEVKLDEAMSSDPRRYTETVYIPGDDRAEQLARINEKIATAARRGDYALIGELTGQAEELESQPVRKARTVPVDTGMTIGEKWASLASDAERREFLVTAGVAVVARLDPVTGLNVVTRLGAGWFDMGGVLVATEDGTVTVLSEL